MVYVVCPFPSSSSANVRRQDFRVQRGDLKEFVMHCFERGEEEKQTQHINKTEERKKMNERLK